MFHKILVAIDESQSSQLTIQHAISLASAFKAQLRFLHVLNPTETDFPQYPLTLMDVGFVMDDGVYQEVLKQYAQQRQEFEKRHRDRLEALVNDAIASDLSADYCLTYGSPSKEICQMAEAWNADAIVMGRRGTSGLSELWLGSVSNYVLHHAPCSVLVIQSTGMTPSQPGAAAEMAHT
mgnify:CR=1 FL=1